MNTDKTDPESPSQFAGALDDDHLLALLNDAATVLARAKLGGLSRVIEFAGLLVFGSPTNGEPYVADICNALEACAALLDSLSRAAEQNTEFDLLGLDEPFAEAGEAMARCESWGLTPGERLGNAIRVMATEVELIRTMAREAQTEPTMRADSRQVALGSIERKADELLAAWGVRKAGDAIPTEENGEQG